ncbi:MAG: histidinol dehydrogenase [Proteobacteria bacterium]|nr:histidinol dehydrogenase [Pseudomonadota bacterium]MBU1449823.1 histidinol dehydrogenase [Pseudomonadota bacterium]MBU2467561.1 histidinol dehydrogenase [Pseudomonadota bacterium]MBU2517280.1 histidinol dehydrogenase [Pseudomonadota bacterium]
MATYLKEAKPKPKEDLTAVRKTVREIIEKVRTEGEAGVRYYSEKFDKWSPPSFKLGEQEIQNVKKQLPQSMVEDIEFCQAQIRNFAQAQMDTLNDMEVETLPGVHLGQKIIPIQSSGSYVPGGRYPMLASAHMTVVTPKVAGVNRVVACSPPAQDTGPYPATIYSMAAAGADEIYCMGGVHALAAMAYGMEGLEPVDLVVGAGNKYVAEAKRQLFGDVGIDLLAGPTEILVIADDHADPRIVAADLLGQAEHDPNCRICLLALSKKIADSTLAELEKQLEVLPTKEVASISWRDGGEIILADSSEEAVTISDKWAPEHLEVQTADWRYFLDNCRNYGSMFCGEETTVAYGDKTIGTNHVLPTMRAARYTGGLFVGKFVKTVTYQYASQEASLKIAEVCERACNYEKMLAHGISCRARVEKYGK